MLVISIVIATAQTTGKKVPVDSLLHLGRGLSQQSIEEVFGSKARHEFTARIEDRLYRCVSFSFDSKGRYYFVFTNDALAKICELPKREFRRVPYRDKWLEYPDRSDPEKRMRETLDSPDLTPAALAESLQRRVAARQGDSLNVLPAFVIGAPFWAATAPLRAKERVEIEALAKKYDPQRVVPEMSIEQVDAMFGDPAFKESMDTRREIRYYGSHKLGADPLLWISVVFDEGRAVRVFSDDFFDLEKIFPKQQ
jgi:hypothetical protein